MALTDTFEDVADEMNSDDPDIIVAEYEEEYENSGPWGEVSRLLDGAVVRMDAEKLPNGRNY